MKVRLAHRPGAIRVSANSVTALGGLAAIAAVLPGHGPATPADTTPAVPAAQDNAIFAAHGFGVRVMPRRHTDSALALYRVRPGDSISAVAVDKCHGQDKDWTGIYAASRKAHLTARNANVLTIGQQLAIDCRYLPDQAHFAPAPPPPPPAPMVQEVSPALSTSAAPVRHHHHYRSVSNLGGSVRAGGSYEQCVITRESGGQAQVMNSSGHYGLYQFDYGTWVSGGGSGSSFGHASASEQQRVFRSVYAARGTQPWSPSDGC